MCLVHKLENAEFGQVLGQPPSDLIFTNIVPKTVENLKMASGGKRLHGGGGGGGLIDLPPPPPPPRSLEHCFVFFSPISFIPLQNLSLFIQSGI